ncbi:MAG: BamA/TamA family outer membrane protein [Betaproteobacteria bacterium]
MTYGHRVQWIAPLLYLVIALAARNCFAESTADDDTARIRFSVVIDAPRALKATLEKTLDLVRWQDYDEMTAVVLDRLLREGIDQVKEAAAAEGYFSPRVDLAVDAAGDPGARRIVRVTLEPGEAVHIEAVHLTVTGPAAQGDALGSAAIAQMRRNWQLPEGSRFRQVAWDDAKLQTATTLASSAYAAARITRSEARIDPESRSAVLDVEIESGPPFYFGAIEVEGLETYDLAMVRNFNTLTVGEPYTSERLDQYVRRLQASGYFASVQARLDPDPATAQAGIIRIAGIEAPRRRIEGGIAYSTDSAIRGDLRYTDVNVDRRATQFELEGRLDLKIQNLGFRLTRPPTATGYLDALQAKVERTDIAGLRTRTALLGVRRHTLEERNRTGYSLTYYEDDQRPADFPTERSHALYAALDHTWRNVDVLIAPTRGYVLNTEIGVAPIATRSFGRGIAQFAAYMPLGRDNTIQFRAEAGAVLASTRSGVPSALLFRTGGDTTVRGYAFESLGVTRGEATIGGRYYAVGSVEAAHYFTEQLGAAVFVDAGNAGDNLSQLRPVVGYGAGARIKSPVGPLRIDLAYGEARRQLRLHMSVGITF